jgi:hypothetical protein
LCKKGEEAVPRIRRSSTSTTTDNNSLADPYGPYQQLAGHTIIDLREKEPALNLGSLFIYQIERRLGGMSGGKVSQDGEVITYRATNGNIYLFTAPKF